MRRIRYMWLRWRLRMYRTPVGRWLPGALSRPVRYLLIFWCLLIVGAGLVAVHGRYPHVRGWATATAGQAWTSLRAAASELLPGLVSWAQAEGRLGAAALREGLPMGVWETGPEPPPAPDWGRDVRAVVYALTRYDLQSPHTLLEAGLPGLAQYSQDIRRGLLPPPAPESSVGRVVITPDDPDSTAKRELSSQEASVQVSFPQVPSTPAMPPQPSGPEPSPFPGPDPDAPAGRPHDSDPDPGAAPPGAPEPPADPGGPPSAPGAVPDWWARLRSVQWGQGCRVLIYHTHTSETYRTGSFAPADEDAYHIWNTTETGIVAVGRALRQRLEDVYGIPTCHSVEIHDWPSHPRAYIQSRTTVQQILARNPYVELVVDVHRDAPPGLVATVGGQRVAQLALVVGTNSAMHPGWRQNLAFAEELGARLAQRFPGLFRRVIQRPDSRLNQDLHPRAVLVEVGSYDNHLDEALYAAELLADVLAEMMAGIVLDSPPGVAPR